MKHLLLILGVLVSLTSTSFSQTYMCQAGSISFFQSTPVEDIDARSNRLLSVLNPANNAIAYKIDVRTFIFEKSLMQDHFNENYIESSKYPYATYVGVINEKIDWTKDGVYDITSTGKLTLHGVTKDITEKGKLSIHNGEITISNMFNIKFTDYGVEIPKLLIKDLSDTVEMNINCMYTKSKTK